jgi:membrane protein YdbS with pleckstrin-like domain
VREPAGWLDPAVRRMWWTIGAIIIVLVTAAAATASALLLEVPPALLVLAVAAVSLPSLFLPPFMYRRWRYEIRERDLYLSRGAVFYKRVLVPFDRIQFVETQHGPLDRAFGLAQVVVYTAGGKAATVPGLKEDEAEGLREELSRVAGTETV